MAQMHGRKLFAGVESVKGFFAFDVAPVHEIEHPFRSCNHALFLHIWPGKALVLGWWKKRHGETENLMRALEARIYEDFEKKEKRNVSFAVVPNCLQEGAPTGEI